MQRLEVSGAERPIYGSLGVKRLKTAVQFLYIGTYGGGGSGERRRNREAQGLRLAPVFMARDISKKYQSQTHWLSVH